MSTISKPGTEISTSPVSGFNRRLEHGSLVSVVTSMFKGPIPVEAVIV